MTDAAPTTPTAPPSAFRFWLVVGAIALVGLVLRVLGSLGELWLDEIWSLHFVAQQSSAWNVLTQFNNETNHHLMSLWMWCVGADKPAWVYRAPSVVFGTLAVLIAARIGRRRSFTSGIMSAGVVSISYLMVHYASEARGYAMAVCMALLAYDALDLYLLHARRRDVLVYGVAVVVGVLGNLTFGIVALSLGFWAVVGLYATQPARAALGRLILLHLIPLGGIGAIGWLSVRHMTPGDGPVLPLGTVVRETLTYAIGFPTASGWGTLACVAVIMTIFLLLGRLLRRRDVKVIFFASVIFVVPVMLLALTGRPFVYPRYFLTGVCFASILFAFAMADLFDHTRWRGRCAILILLCTWAWGNLTLCFELARIGRGNFAGAIDDIVRASTDDQTRIGSLSDTRLFFIVGYHATHYDVSRRPVVVRQTDLATVRPNWILTAFSPAEVSTAPRRLQVAPRLEYVLVKVYPSVHLSGFPAGVYVRDTAPR